MAFSLPALRAMDAAPVVPATGISVQRYVYVTDDAQATVIGATYFDTAAHILRAGDIIDIVCVLTGTPLLLTRIVTASNGLSTGGDVTTAYQTVS